MDKINDIRARAQAATPGPWQEGERKNPCRCSDGDECLHGIADPAENWNCLTSVQQKFCHMECEHCYVAEHMLGVTPVFFHEGGHSKIVILQADAEFIANARQDIPYLLDEIDRITKRNHSLDLDCQHCFESWQEECSKNLELLKLIAYCDSCVHFGARTPDGMGVCKKESTCWQDASPDDYHPDCFEWSKLFETCQRKSSRIF